MADLAALWTELANTALLGSDRRPLPELRSADPALARVLAGAQSLPEDRRLLASAAVLSAYRRSGKQPDLRPPGLPLPEACPPDEWPVCAGAARAVLAQLIATQALPLLQEMIRLLAENHRRAPEETLPELLELFHPRQAAHLVEQSEFFADLLSVIGMRGRWLAAHQPQWSYAALPVDTATREQVANAWATGDQPTRLGILASQRRVDAAFARALVESTWKDEPAGLRAASLANFEAGLSLADEPFLEAALDDRSKEVRRQAAALLARLPDSALVARMTTRVQALISFSTRRLIVQREAINVTLPETCDESMQRDGVEVKPGADGNGLGEKAWWLLQMLRCVPPVAWSQAWGRSPAQLIETAYHSEHRDLLYEGWIAAALRHPDPDWLEALLHAFPTRWQLLARLPLERQEAVLLDWISNRSLPQGMAMLLSYQGPLSLELSRAFIANLRAYYPTLLSEGERRMSQVMSEFCYRLDPAVLPEANRLLNARSSDHVWLQMITDLVQMLAYRAEMRQAAAMA